MDSDPFYDTVAKVFPIFLLAALGLLCIYSVVGVPLGLILIGVAAWMAYRRFHAEA